MSDPRLAGGQGRLLYDAVLDGPCRRPADPRLTAPGRVLIGPYTVRIDNLLSMFLRPDFECLQQLVNFILDRLIMRALVAGRTAPQGPLFRDQSRKSVDSTSVSSAAHGRMLWNSLRHLSENLWMLPEPCFRSHL